MSARAWIIVLTVTLGVLFSFVLADESRVHVDSGSDPHAIELAQRTVAAMGGWAAYDAVRYVSWDFFGRRQHYWDRKTNDARIESESDGVQTVMLVNVATRQGRVFRDGAELAGDELVEALEAAHQIWINDSYWMFMPYKLLDPGVTLGYVGEKTTAAGNAADVLDLTFGEGVGYTPQNRYHIYIGKESGLVEQWDFYAEASASEPNFAMPWAAWRTFGGIKLATDHGRGADWKIRVHESMPPAVFRDPAPLAL